MRKIIGFFGGDSQVGTTMTAQSFAEKLAERNKKVLFISGSGKFGDPFRTLSEKHSIDDLKAAVRSGEVSADEFSQTIEKCRGIYVLPSVRNPLNAKYFPENTYEIMLKSAAEEFDYVVIDGGNDANLGLTISALSFADRRYFITTQQPMALKRLAMLNQSILQPLNFGGKLIINKFMYDPSLFLQKEIAEITQFDVKEIRTLPYIEYGWQAEMEGKSLLHFRSFGNAVSQIADELEPPQEDKKYGKRILFRRVSQ